MVHQKGRNTQRASRILGAITAVTLLFLAALALNISPCLRGPEEWRWAYAIPGQPLRLFIPAITLLLYLALAYSLLPTPYFLPLTVLSVPLIQSSLLIVNHPDVIMPLFFRTISPSASGIFSVGSTIQDVGDFLQRYPDLMPSFPVHPQRYPPGLPLLFYLARRVLEAMPALADALGFRLRLYQCQDLVLMRLPNATIGSAIVQMSLPLLSGLTVLPLYGLARQLYDRRTAKWAAALYPLVPSFALWSARWEQFFPLLTCTTWYLFYLGLTRARRQTTWRSALCSLASGFVLSIASMLNFSMLAILLPLGLFTLLWLLSNSPSPILHSLFSLHHSSFIILHSLFFLIGLSSLWIVYQLAFGTGFFDIWRVSMSYHLGLHRSYWTWLFYHLYDFFIFLGLPLALLFGVALIKALRDPLSNPQPLILGFALGLLLLDLSGTSRGEVARVWLFLTPFAALVAARGLNRLRLERVKLGFIVIAIIMALQLFSFNAFLRVVTTGVPDPSDRAHTFELLPAAHIKDARFGDSIALLGYDLAPVSGPYHPGDTLRLQLHWRALRPMTHPYTVFTHLIGPDGQLLAQQDNMPVQDEVPTTCWVPGEVIADPYDIPIPPDAPPGEYRLEIGLYLLSTGERLPIFAEGAGSEIIANRSLILAHIPIGER